MPAAAEEPPVREHEQLEFLTPLPSARPNALTLDDDSCLSLCVRAIFLRSRCISLS